MKDSKSLGLRFCSAFVGDATPNAWPIRSFGEQRTPIVERAAIAVTTLLLGKMLPDSANVELASRLEAGKRLQEQRSAGATTNLNNAAKAGITPRNDMEFPAAWKQIVENRAKLAVVGLTKKEKELLKALDTPLIVNFNKTRFRDAIDFFADKSGYPIAIHADSLVEVMASATIR